MRRWLLALGFLEIAVSAHAQFVFPTEADHRHDPGLYTEDPFIVEYRRRFFAVFHGDYKTFRDAYSEIAQRVVSHPNDARAWSGSAMAKPWMPPWTY